MSLPEVLQPADEYAERSTILMALETAQMRTELLGECHRAHFSGALRPMLWELIETRAKEGFPLQDLGELRTAYLGLPDQIRIPPASAENEFRAVSDANFRGDVASYLQRLRLFAAKRGILRGAERVYRAAGNGATPEELKALIQGLNAELPVASASPLTWINSEGYDPDEKVQPEFGTESGEIVMPQGDLVLVAAEVGAGKTLFLLDACIATMQGLPFLGFPRAGAGKAMMIQAEGDGMKPTRRRAVRIITGRGGQVEQLDSPRFRLAAPDCFCLERPENREALQQNLDRDDPDVLALDSLTAIADPQRESGSAAAVGEFIREFIRPLQKRPDGSRRTLLLSHHLRKPSAGPGANSLKARIAGSFYTLGSVDSCLGLEGSGPEGFRVRLVKRTRWGSRFEPFLVAIEGEANAPLSLSNRGSLKPSSAQLGADEDEVLEGFSALPDTSDPEGWIRLADVKRHAGIGREDAKRGKRYDRAADRLHEAGRLDKHPDRRRTYKVIPLREPGEGE